MIAALYVEKNGTYFGLEGVDPWDEERDARLYAGPWPVVAHPPCQRWCALAPMTAALSAVVNFGGVLEHPAYSYAWPAFDLPEPTPGGWTRSFFDEGWTCEIDQAAYGHRARKRTWLYYVGDSPPVMRWGSPEYTGRVSSFGHGRKISESERVRPAEASRSPVAFRDALLGMARSAVRPPSLLS